MKLPSIGATFVGVTSIGLTIEEFERCCSCFCWKLTALVGIDKKLLEFTILVFGSSVFILSCLDAELRTMESFNSDKLASLFKVLLFGGLALVPIPLVPTEVASFESAPSELSRFILLGR